MATTEVRLAMRVMTACPADGTEVFTGHRMRQAELEGLREPRAFRCPRCEKIHSWTAESAWCEERTR